MQRPLFDAGALPLTLSQLPDAIDSALDRVDALVLAPGRDIDPARYGQSPDPLLAPTDPWRDEFELALVPAALARGMPVLGVCRGMQILNVALGGTMVQDVRLAPSFADHPSDPGWKTWKQMERAALAAGSDGGGVSVPPHPRHAISVAQPSILFDALGVSEATVNSFHHQALGLLGDGLRATAVAPDGVVEAIELDGSQVLGVQWELQEEWRIDSRFRAVFDWFVAAAAEWRAAL